MRIKNYFLVGSVLLTLVSFNYINNNQHDPIVTRHDKDDAEFLKIAERFENYMFHFKRSGCEGTIIGDQWEMTAAHCAIAIKEDLRAGKKHFVTINDQEIEVDKVISYNKLGIRFADMSLVHLKKNRLMQCKRNYTLTMTN